MPSVAERRRLLAALARGEANLRLDVDGHALALTSLERVYWPAAPALAQAALTKRDYLLHLVRVAPYVLPFLQDRPLTLFRWPTGIAGRRVLQKHWEIALPPFVERATVFSETKGHDDEYILCNNLPTLLWLGHMGALELHAWHSRVRAGADVPAGSRSRAIDLPDYILFDLDPFVYTGSETRAGEPEPSARGFALCVRVALWLEALLGRMGLRSWVKTSGKTGLHVVVPIRRTLPYDAVRETARFIAEHLLREHPEEITVDWTVEKRRGKVFIDYNMNVRGKSMSVPYSPRGLQGATVSMPVGWRELRRVSPSDFRIPTVEPRLRRRGDAWSGVLAGRQDLRAVLSARR